MVSVVLGSWIRKLFSSGGAGDRAAQGEEYGLRDRGEAELEQDRFGTFAGAEATEAAEDDLDEFKAPRDPAP
jgi:hypothetical protein